jgi:acylphosphatase
MSSEVGAELRISGVVQGVGFRYYTYRQAVNLGLTGWVTNEPDGSVLVVVEGDRSVVEELIEAVKVGPPSSSVSDVGVHWRPFKARFTNFEIRSGRSGNL